MYVPADVYNFLTPKPMWYTFVYFARRPMERRTAPVADDGLARRRTRLRLMRHDHTRVA